MSDASTFALMARLLVSLAVVLGLLGLVAWVAKRRLPNGRAGRGQLEVVARTTLGRTASVQVVRVGERAILLGVTDQHVTYLSEGELGDFLDAPAASAAAGELGAGDDGYTIDLGRTGGATAGAPRTGSTWTGFVEALRDRTARR